MALVISPVLNKKETSPIKIITPEGDEIILVVNHCDKRKGSIKVKIVADKKFDIQRLPSQKSLLQIKKDSQLVKAINGNY